MKKYALVFTTLVSLSVAQGYAVAGSDGKMKKSMMDRKAVARKVYSSYLASLILSGCIGATTGSIVRYLEKRLNVEASPISLFLIFLGWAFESEFRNDILIGLQKELDANEIGHKKSLMFKSAWAASWIAYLQK